LQIYPSLKEEGSVLGGATQRVTKYVPISVLFSLLQTLFAHFTIINRGKQQVLSDTI